MSVEVRPLPTLKGSDPDESVDSSNLHRGNKSGDLSNLRRGISSESIGSDHIPYVKVGIQHKQLLVSWSGQYNLKQRIIDKEGVILLIKKNCYGMMDYWEYGR